MAVGLTLIQEATETLSVPDDWAASLPDDASELHAIYGEVSLDAMHRADLEFLKASYRPDTGAAVHTAMLAELHRIRTKPGIFKTISPGSDPTKPNAFMFPREGGWWMVYRFGRGTSEADTWTQDGVGWTRCAFGRSASLADAAATSGAVKTDKGYFIPTDEALFDFARALGIEITSANAPYNVARRK